MPEIVLDCLCKSFGEDRAADCLSLRIEDGEYVCILGPTGSGKTTCMRMICGLTRPDSGRVLFDGTDVTDFSPDTRKAAMLSQTYALFPHLTVYNNVSFAPRIKNWSEEDSRQIVRSMLHLVHLDKKADWIPGELSGGQQQRVALARALASGSRILLLDEPLRALDARLRIDLRKELRSLAKEMGLTCIHVTHDQDEALEMADRIAILRNGRIIQFGTPREVFENPATPFVANFVGRSNMFVGTVSGHPDGLTEVDVDGVKIHAGQSDIPAGEQAVVAVKIGFTKLSTDPESAGFATGRVERVLYEGATITVDVDAGGLGTVSAKLPNRKFEMFSPGDTVTVSWPETKANVFRLPEGGMEEEMRLDRWQVSNSTGYRCVSAISTRCGTSVSISIRGST